MPLGSPLIIVIHRRINIIQHKHLFCEENFLEIKCRHGLLKWNSKTQSKRYGNPVVLEPVTDLTGCQENNFLWKILSDLQRKKLHCYCKFIADKFYSNGMTPKQLVSNWLVVDTTILYSLLHSKRWTLFSEKHTNHMPPINPESNDMFVSSYCDHSSIQVTE